MKLRVLISPEAKSAYFHDYKQVALEEIRFVLGERPVEEVSVGPLEFLELEAGADELVRLSQLSFVQGLFGLDGDALKPMDVMPDWLLHEDFVFGSKFKGKTNERLTQLLLNLGLAAIDKAPQDKVKLLDPMAGRGTSLLWALRYGMQAFGIEQDARAIDDVRQIVKKWTKVHRQKHKLRDGFIGKPNRQNKGKFIDFQLADNGMRFVIGDAREAAQLIKDKVDLIVSDLPYGVQHFTTDKTRNPLDVIQESLPGWLDRLKKI